ncbi:hypothetical protein MtrunA17_Chr3g0084541 [Medicago truncatula]|uniref:Transmembrane protein n=1 Tax=Medicago truncatula TaxID=3880 RepID=A0A396IM14_MEDTR|nr:hypothetical protein MtrunA17_Chr3g0084541 [Medicago truncatula]
MTRGFTLPGKSGHLGFLRIELLSFVNECFRHRITLLIYFLWTFLVSLFNFSFGVGASKSFFILWKLLNNTATCVRPNNLISLQFEFLFEKFYYELCVNRVP